MCIPTRFNFLLKNAHFILAGDGFSFDVPSRSSGHQLCLRDIHITKCDLFYTDVKLFQNQSQPDTVLDDVSCMLGCTRSSLNVNVIASEKGVVIGRLIISNNGNMIYCNKMGMGGKAIPPNIDQVGDMQSNALFILLVEKDAAYIRLAEDKSSLFFLVLDKCQLERRSSPPWGK